MSQSRRLAAIMFTDIVGYTMLMGRNEQRAFEILDKNREIQKTIIGQFNGCWIKELGDGVLASFNTASEAVAAAVKIQQTCNASQDFQLRIGIHLGEVVFENSDVFGDGVNIAARIQALAPPGGIWISEAVHHNVANKNTIETVFIKAESLKHVKDPVRIFQVQAEGLPPSSIPGAALKKEVARTAHQRKHLFIAFALILMVAAGYVFYAHFQKTSKPAAGDISEENIAKSIAVLPFVNMSDDKEQEYFSDGLSEELINLLANVKGLKVIGRTSSFAFKGKNEDLRKIAQQLGVAHLLEGSVRKEGNKIRLTAQLIEGTNGSHLWSDTYERDLKNIFQLQDEIATAVVHQLKLKLFENPSANNLGKGNIEAYNLMLQGNYFFDKLDKENVAKAVDFYNQALAIDSTDARVWGKLSNAISRQVWQNYIDRKTGREKVNEAATRAIELNEKLAIGYLELADNKLYQEFDWKGAEENYQKAISLEPDNPDVLYGLGGGLYFAIGRWKEAITTMKKCIELDPLKPLSHLNLGNILTYDGKAQEGISYFKKTLELNPQFQRAHLYIGRNYLLTGNTALALNEMRQETLEVFRTFGLALAYHATGQKQEADRALDDFKGKFSNDWSYLLAQLHAYRGEKDEAFRWLENAYHKKDGWLVFLKGDPLLKNIQDDERYEAFFKKMNLPDD